MMVKPSNTPITYAAVLEPSWSASRAKFLFLRFLKKKKKKGKTYRSSKKKQRTNFGILQVEHSFSVYMILSQGYAKRYSETFPALTVPGSEKLVNKKSTIPIPTANKLVYLQEHRIFNQIQNAIMLKGLFCSIRITTMTWHILVNFT